MPTTARHAFPSPASSAVPDVPVDIKALADAVDLQTPWVTTSTPAHSNGLIWRHPTTGATQISDGTSWFPLTNGQLIGGKRRTTNATATSGTTELVVLDTPALSLLASSLYKVEASPMWSPSASGDNYIFRIRQTNLAGAVVAQVTAPGTDLVVPYGTHIAAPYITTSAEASKVFVLTVERLGGTGTCTVNDKTMLTVTYQGSSSILGTA